MALCKLIRRFNFKPQFPAWVNFWKYTPIKLSNLNTFWHWLHHVKDLSLSMENLQPHIFSLSGSLPSAHPGTKPRICQGELSGMEGEQVICCGRARVRRELERSNSKMNFMLSAWNINITILTMVAIRMNMLDIFDLLPTPHIK